MRLSDVPAANGQPRETTAKPKASDWTAEEIIGVLILLTVGLVAGIGAGLLLYWLILD